MTIVDSLRIAYWLIRLNRSQWWPGARIRRYQSDAVVKILRHAADTVPYYRSLGISAKEILSIDDIQKFPLITKRDVQNLRDELLSSDYRKSELNSSITSGSSGEPTTTYFDKNCWLLNKYAQKIRRMLGNDVGLFKRIVVISEQRPEQLRKSERLAGSKLLFDQRTLSIHEPIASHIPTLLDTRIDALYAFPSYLDELVNHCEARKILLPPIPVVFTSSEVLQDTLRTRIETRFGSRVCDIYGSTEFKEIAWQCADGIYHLNFESVYFETFPDESLDDEGRSKVLVTSLTNRAMPLIRYSIGDEFSLNSIACRCGRQSPSLSRISGRVVEMVRLPNNRRISPYVLTTAVESHPEIAKYQIVQSSLDDVEVRYVSKSRDLLEADVRSIQSALRGYLGNAMCIRIRAVSEIPRTIGGKHRVFVQAMEP
jgi:phenylacetate-CoA ligase